MKRIALFACCLLLMSGCSQKSAGADSVSAPAAETSSAASSEASVESNFEESEKQEAPADSVGPTFAHYSDGAVSIPYKNVAKYNVPADWYAELDAGDNLWLSPSDSGDPFMAINFKRSSEAFPVDSVIGEAEKYMSRFRGNNGDGTGRVFQLDSRAPAAISYCQRDGVEYAVICSIVDNFEILYYYMSLYPFMDFSDDVNKILSSFELLLQDSTAVSASVDEEPVKPSVGEANALSSAKDYLRFGAFSYSGLVSQLEYEGFSHDESVYGADNCGADWNEQAVRCANEYLEYSSFSRSELVDQLIYEGFTSEQAEYGVSQAYD